MKKTIFLILAVFALVLGNSALGDAASGHGGFGGHSGGAFAARGGSFGGHGGHFDGRGGHFAGRGGHFDGRGRHFHGHDDHFNVGVVIGPGWEPWWGPYPFDYPYDYASPVIVQSDPAVIVEPDQEQNYWYFCNDPNGYYPYVKQCPGGWMKVVPSPTPSGP